MSQRLPIARQVVRLEGRENEYLKAVEEVPFTSLRLIPFRLVLHLGRKRPIHAPRAARQNRPISAPGRTACAIFVLPLQL